MGQGGSRVVPGGLRPGLSPARLRARVAQANRGETAEDRAGQRHRLLAPPQLRHQLHDRDRRGVGVSVAAGGAGRCSLAADDRFRPQRHVLVSPHRTAGAKQPGGDHRARRGRVARAPGGGRASRRLGRPEGLRRDHRRRGGCVLGIALTASADDIHLQGAYGVFAAEARDVAPAYAPETVSTDGWAATRNAFLAWFPLLTVVLCGLHGCLKVRDRCRTARELHRRVWDVYRAATAEEFRRLMDALQQWCATQTWTASVCEIADEAVEPDGDLRGGLC